MWEKRSRRMLVFVFLTASFLYVQMALFVVQFVFHVRMSANVFDFCLEMLHLIGFPVRVNAILFLFGTTMAISLAAAVREAVAAYRWNKAERLLGRADWTREIGERCGLGPRELTIIEHPDAVAMTLGFARPRIVLSTGLIGALGENELQAVVAHEKCHLDRRHPLAVFGLSVVGIAFWYIPIYRWMIAKYKVLIELTADRYAVQSAGGAASLGGALLVLLKRGQAASSVLSNVSFADRAIDIRLKLLVDPQFKPSFRPPIVSCVLSAVAFAFIVFGF